jgi:capsular polysaccharide biosynthesis protein
MSLHRRFQALRGYISRRANVRNDRYQGPVSCEYVSPLDLATGLRSDPTLHGTLDGGQDWHQVTRPGPSFHDDPDDAGLFPLLDSLTISLPPPFTLTAADVHQVGYRSFLSRNGFLFNDEALINEIERDRFLARLSEETAFPNEDTGLLPAGESRLFRLSAGKRSVEYLPGSVVSLCSHEPSNYGSFLLRVLPKMAERRSLLKYKKFIGPLYNESMRALYEMANIQVNNIVFHNTNIIYAYDEAIIPSLRNPHYLVDQESLAFYAELRDRFGSRKRAKKIFVSRLGWEGGAGTRVMLNEEELARRVVGAGFDVVRPHSMSIQQQVEAFSSADVIVGASGSAMFNTVFSHPGTKLIDIESEPHWIFAHQNLFGSCGLDYGIFEARAVDQDWSSSHKPFSVNVKALLSRIGSH